MADLEGEQEGHANQINAGGQEIPHLPTKESEKTSGRIIGLKYDIAIHLPATKDIEVYNAIFKSLREHLVD